MRSPQLLVQNNIDREDAELALELATKQDAPAFVIRGWQETKTEHSGLSLRFSAGMPMMSEDTPQKARFLAIKSASDTAISLLLLATLSPILLALAIAIKLTSKGPVFFTQVREGLNGVHFRMYKFRSLHWEHSDLSGLKIVSQDDPRLTRIGAFLRQTSLDELPQLINIIRGEMSLIGPRPQVPGMLIKDQRYDEVVPYYSLRHQIKPGLTGWAQANGLRGPVETAEAAKARIDHDLAYAEHISFGLDMKILVWTALQEIKRIFGATFQNRRGGH